MINRNTDRIESWKLHFKDLWKYIFQICWSLWNTISFLTIFCKYRKMKMWGILKAELSDWQKTKQTSPSSWRKQHPGRAVAVTLNYYRVLQLLYRYNILRTCLLPLKHGLSTIHQQLGSLPTKIIIDCIVLRIIVNLTARKCR